MGGQVSQHRAAHLGHESRIRFPTTETQSLHTLKHTNTHTRVCEYLDEERSMCRSVLGMSCLKKKQNNKQHLFPGTNVPKRCGHAGVSLARRMEGKSECVLTNHSLLPPRGESGVREHSEECRDWITGDES